jgi:hypothetical protein
MVHTSIDRLCPVPNSRVAEVIALSTVLNQVHKSRVGSRIDSKNKNILLSEFATHRSYHTVLETWPPPHQPPTRRETTMTPTQYTLSPMSTLPHTFSTSPLTSLQHPRAPTPRSPSRTTLRTNESPHHPRSLIRPFRPQSPRHRLRHRHRNARHRLAVPRGTGLRIGFIACAECPRETKQYRVCAGRFQ